MDFIQAEKRFKQLKAQFEAGKLAETEFKNQLEELMIQDEQGDWWMIGYETEQWYRHDDNDWVQSNPPHRVSQESTQAFNRGSIFWIMSGFALGWGIAGASIALAMDLPIVLVIAWVIGWAIGGFVTAITLHFRLAIKDSKSVLWITLGWAIAFLIGLAVTIDITMELAVFGASVGAIGGGVGGLVTGIILRNEHALSSLKSMIWTTLAWSIGGLIGGGVGLSIGPSIGSSIGDLIGLPIGLGLGGAICGGIGGLVTIWQIK